MSRSSAATGARRLWGLWLALAGSALACSGVEEVGPSQAAVHSGEAPPAARLARIHVVLQPPGEFTGDEPPLEVSAVFAQYRGFDESAARARLDLRAPPQDRLRPGQCEPSDLLALSSEPVSKDSLPVSRDSLPARELSLIDVGNLTVRLGEASLDVPLALLPDLVPYMSGVTYEYVSDALPPGAWPAGEPAPAELALRVDGDGDELPGFTLRQPLPEPVALQAELSPDGGSLRLDWRPDGRGEPVALRLQGQIGGEAVGDEITCLVDDDGSYRLDLDDLRDRGLDGAAGNALRITATRAARTLFDVGEFTGAEALVELRTLLVLGT